MRNLSIVISLFLMQSCSTHKETERITESTSPVSLSESLLVCPKAPQDPKFLWSLTGFSAPESVVYDSKSNSLYVSNVVGSPVEKDARGWISKVSLAGTMIQLKWSDGSQAISSDLKSPFNAPKGLRIRDGILWISDIDTVNGVRISNAKKSVVVRIPDAKFLNDVAFYGDRIYVSDTIVGKIYSIQKTPPYQVIAEGPDLESPNGLLADNSSLLIASWGRDLKSDFSTSTSGHVLDFDLKSKKITPWTKKAMGNLDGIEIDGEDSVIVSDWVAGKVFHLKKSGDCITLLEGFKGSADISFLPKTRTLIIPLMGEDRLVAYKIPAIN